MKMMIMMKLRNDGEFDDEDDNKDESEDGNEYYDIT